MCRSLESRLKILVVTINGDLFLYKCVITKFAANNKGSRIR